MTDLGPPEDSTDHGPEPGPEAAILDRLIAWAMGRADADADRIAAYFEERAARPGPGWARTYRRDELPYRGRGRDQACSAALRRLRAHHGFAAQRPLGAGRPPRSRRLPG